MAARVFPLMLVLVLASLVGPSQATAQDACYLCEYDSEIGCVICKQQPQAVDGYDDCSQLSCDDCQAKGNPCTATVAVSDLSPDGSLLAISESPPVGVVFAGAVVIPVRDAQVSRRACDGAILARHYSAQFSDKLRLEAQSITI